MVKDYGDYDSHSEAPDPFTFPGTDIYAELVLGPGKADFFIFGEEPGWFPILIELTGNSVQNFARGKGRNGEDLIEVEDEDEDWSRIVHVPGLYLTANLVADPLYLTIMVREGFLRALDNNKGLQAIVPRLTLGAPVDHFPSDPTLFAPAPPDGYEFPATPNLEGNPPSENIAIIGVIDDGLAFAHERFRDDTTSTRIRYAWLQDGEFNTPGLLPFGKELTKTEIDGALVSEGDDIAVYRELNALKFERVTHKSIAHRISHGAHLMDLATGYNRPGTIDSDLPTDCKLPIICVQLPTETTAESSGGSLVPYVNLAIDYIFNRADIIADEMCVGPIPVVINFSYGHHLGPHDGTELLEAAIDRKVRARRAATNVACNVVVPAGNSYLTRTYAQVPFERVGETRVLDWRVLPDDQTFSTLDIWLPRGAAADRIEVRVTFPSGETSPALGEDSGASNSLNLLDSAGRLHGKVIYRFDGASGRSHFSVVLFPSQRVLRPSEPKALSGIWRIHLTNLDMTPGDIVNAWIGRDDTPIGFPIRGQQSYFDHNDYEVYDDNGRYIKTDDSACLVKRAGTISGIATGDETIVIGGYYRKPIYRIEDGLETYRLAEYSASGPTNEAPNRNGPDAVAVSEDSRVHRGVLAAGSQSGSTVSLNGTSVAAPQITREIALRMAKGEPVDRSVVQSWVDPASSPLPANRPDSRWGCGRIHTPPVRPRQRFED